MLIFTRTIFRRLIATPFSTSNDLMPFVRTKLKSLNTDYVNLERKFNEEGGGSHKKRRQQFEKLGRFATLFQQLQSTQKNIEDLKKMAQEDKDSQEFVNEELVKYYQELDKIQEATIDELKQPALYDDYQEIRIELRPGVGGSQSSLFTQDIANMYQRYIATQGWSLSILQQQKDFNVKQGLKFCQLKVVGEGCYQKMKCQSGVHKVIRVPQTQSKGRLHSSTMSVVVVPYIPFDYSINDKDIKYQYTRAQGAGGQHVNKTDSACRATHIPTGLAVFIQQHRVQDQNKRRATQILKQRLFQMQYQKNVQEQAKRRKIQIGTGDRSQKIRTYNFPQDRITDHRIGLTLFGMSKMLGGSYLQQFIQTFQAKIDKIQRQQAINLLKS